MEGEPDRSASPLAAQLSRLAAARSRTRPRATPKSIDISRTANRWPGTTDFGCSPSGSTVQAVGDRLRSTNRPGWSGWRSTRPTTVWKSRVALHVVAGQGRPLGQDEEMPVDLEHRGRRRNGLAVPASLLRLVGVPEQRRGASRAHGGTVLQTQDVPPPHTFDDPPGQVRVAEPGREGLHEHVPEEARVQLPPDQHRVAGQWSVGSVVRVEHEEGVRPEVEDRQVVLGGTSTRLPVIGRLHSRPLRAGGRGRTGRRETPPGSTDRWRSGEAPPRARSRAP